MTGVTLGACRNIHHRCLRPSIVGVGVVKRLQVSNLQRLALNLENPNLCHGSIVLSSSKIKAAHNDISKLLYIKDNSLWAFAWLMFIIFRFSKTENLTKIPVSKPNLRSKCRRSLNWKKKGAIQK